ncbi:amino acid adenylation domain-containing protein, partial [Paucibacter sp. APW11]
EAPRGELEAAIAAIWCELLGRDQVGRDDHFFELGGHSLLAVRLMSRLQQQFAAEVALRDLFEHPTLAAFAARISPACVEGVKGSPGAGGRERAVVPADRSRPLPLSWAQQRLWFLAQLDSAASAAYHLPSALRLRGELDLKALEATLNRIVARHENLRTRFVQSDGQPVQVIDSPDIGFKLDQADLSSLRGHEQAAAVERKALDHASMPFDLAIGPLIRGTLLRLGHDEHVLLINQHHIISDGWSAGVLVREVSQLYAAFSAGQVDPLPALAIQYADYAAWQREWLQGERLAAQLDFWQSRLAGAPELLTLPSDRPRPAQQSYAGASIAFEIGAELDRGLRALGQRHGVTLYMTLLAAWAVLMARLSGQNEVVIGSPIANRQSAELEGLIGFFSNTLALRVAVFGGDDGGGELDLGALLAAVKSDLLRAYEYQDLPLDQVVEAVKPQRSLAYSPLFQTMLTLNSRGTQDEALHLPGLELSSWATTLGSSKFDLSISVQEMEQPGLLATILYATDLFDAATIERWIKSFVCLLEGMVQDDKRSVQRLPLQPVAERNSLLEAFNPAPVEHERDTRIEQRFEAIALQQPDAPAIVCEDRALSYLQLEQRANQLAHVLVRLGVRPGQPVALCLSRSVEMAVGWLGILKAGAVYVPMEPNQPLQRLRHMVQDSGVALILTQLALEDELRQLGGIELLALDADTRLSSAPVNALNLSVGEARAGEALAYMIYTSGSTGASKAVMVEHHCALNFWQAMRETTHQGCPPQARIALNASFAFDMSWKGWLQLLSGHCVHLVPQELRGDGARVLAFLRRHEIDAFDSTPSQLELLLAAGLLEPHAHQPKAVLLGGEPIAQQTWDRLRRARHISFFNMYGPTECTVDATLGEIGEDDARPHIGKPLRNARIYILDRCGEPVPVGVAGEIYIGGAGVARGYLKREALTAERFLVDPFQAGARMYRTGDLARWLPNGKIEYLGRNDFQVKIRGFRIELGEIEARLVACAGVREAAVLARQDSADDDKRLVAYVVPDADPSAKDVALDISALRAQLARELPDYMVPSAFVQLQALPLTANGKLDRKALPAPDQRAIVARDYEPPQDLFEETIAAIWAELLKLDRVGRHDDFFALGGHSLLAVQQGSRLRERLGIEVPLRSLFAHPTLFEYALQARAGEHSKLDAIQPADRGARLPLSWAQQRLWFLAQLDQAASAAYHMPAALQLQGSLNRAALSATLNRIVARHESLRTRFVQQGDVVGQVIDEADSGFALAEEDLTSLRGHEQQAAVQRLMLDHASMPFDLAQGPLIRGKLLKLGDTDHVLLINQHHIVSDGWSMGILVREVCALYAAFSEGREDPLSPLPIQYADYAAWQRQWLQGERLQQQLGYWKQRLAGAPDLLALPTDRPRPAQQSFAGASVAFEFDAELTHGLKALARHHGATLYMTLLAGWAVLMSRLSGQDDIVIGSPIANRQRAEIEGLIGFFLNTLAMRVELGASQAEACSVAGLLRVVRDSVLQAQAHQDVPFEQVLDAVQPARSLSHNALFQTMLTLNNTPEAGESALPGLSLRSIVQEHEASYCDLYASLAESGGAIKGSIVYATALFDAETIERFAGYYRRVLEGMVADATQRVDRLALLDE